MPKIRVPDGEGNAMSFSEFNGRFYVDLSTLGYEPGDMLRELAQTFKPRPDDVYLFAYPKSGTHWTHEVVYMLLNETTELCGQIKEKYMMEFMKCPKLEERKSPRILNSHLRPSELPLKKIYDSGAKVIQITRNPKDVLVSYYHHMFGINDYEYSGSWNGFFPTALKGDIEYGSWFQYITEWWKESNDNQGKILWISYERLIENPVSEIRRIAHFLGVRSPAAFSDQSTFHQQIAKACSFDNMKKIKGPMDFNGTLVDENENPDPQTNTSGAVWKPNVDGMYRKGKVGDWANHFTVAQNETFDAVFAERITDPELKKLIRFQL